MEYDVEQIEAINLCCDLTKRIVAVTGEAGTGKTTIIKAVYKKLINYIDNNRSKFMKNYVEDKDKYHFNPENYVVLVAPTGKAAKRIYEATDDRNSFTKNRYACKCLWFSLYYRRHLSSGRRDPGAPGQIQNTLMRSKPWSAEKRTCCSTLLRTEHGQAGRACWNRWNAP